MNTHLFYYLHYLDKLCRRSWRCSRIL